MPLTYKLKVCLQKTLKSKDVFYSGSPSALLFTLLYALVIGTSSQFTRKFSLSLSFPLSPSLSHTRMHAHTHTHTRTPTRIISKQTSRHHSSATLLLNLVLLSCNIPFAASLVVCAVCKSNK